jgi:hypothetical protein
VSIGEAINMQDVSVSCPIQDDDGGQGAHALERQTYTLRLLLHQTVLILTGVARTYYWDGRCSDDHLTFVAEQLERVAGVLRDATGTVDGAGELR